MCLQYPAVPERFAWFARFLLEGKVIAELDKYTAVLLSPPSTMVKTWAKSVCVCVCVCGGGREAGGGGCVCVFVVGSGGMWVCVCVCVCVCV